MRSRFLSTSIILIAIFGSNAVADKVRVPVKKWKESYTFNGWGGPASDRSYSTVAELIPDLERKFATDRGSGLCPAVAGKIDPGPSIAVAPGESGKRASGGAWPSLEAPLYLNLCHGFTTSPGWFPQFWPGTDEEKSNKTCIEVSIINPQPGCAPPETGYWTDSITLYKETAPVCPDGFAYAGSGMCECLTNDCESEDFDFGGICNDGDEVRDEINPANLSTGSKYQGEVDYVGGGDFPIKLIRYYDSRAAMRARLAIIDAGGYGSGGGSFVVGGVKRPPMPFGVSWQSNLHLVRMPLAVGGIKQNFFARPNGKTVLGGKVSDGSYKILAPSRLSTLNGLIEQKDASGAHLGFVLKDAEAKQEEYYDKAGNLVSIKKIGGRFQNFYYNPAGQLQYIADTNGRRVEFRYDGFGRVYEVITPRSIPDPTTGVYSRTLKYTYDVHGNITTFTNSHGGVRTYLYENAAFPTALTGIKNELGQRVRTWSYDGSGYFRGFIVGSSGTKRKNVEGTKVGGFTYDVSEKNEAGFVTRSTSYKSERRGGTRVVTSVTGDKCAKCKTKLGSKAYDTSDRLVGRTSPSGVEDRFAYSPTSPQLPIRYNRAASVPAVSQMTNLTWDEPKKLPSEVDNAYFRSTFVYDGDGSILTKTDYDKITGRTRTYSYNYEVLNGRKKLRYSYDPKNSKTEYRYTTLGDLQYVINPVGHVTAYGINPTSGQLSWVRDPNNVYTYFGYGSHGKLTSVHTHSNLRIKTISYDAAIRVTRITNPDKSFLHIEYNDANQVKKIYNEFGDYALFEYDEFGNLRKSNVFSSTGQLVSAVAREFNRFGELEKAMGSTTPRSLTFAYDAEENIKEIKDALGNTTFNDFDALNRLTNVRLPNASQLSFEYDGKNRLTKVTDANYLSTKMSYDGFGNTVRVENPDTGVLTMDYDINGNLLWSKNAQGKVTNFTYDVLNRPTSVLPPDPKLAVTNIYDEGVYGKGRLTTIRDNNGYTAYFYNAFGDITHVAQTLAGVETRTVYNYDTLGRLVSVQYPSTRLITYNYTSVGSRITSITSTFNGVVSTLATNVVYLPFGLLKGWTFGNGATLSRSFDLDYNLTGQTTTAGTATIENTSYGYDPNQLIQSVGDTADAAQNQSFSYTAMGELKTAVGNYGTKTYNLDRNGNRLATNTALPANAAVFETGLKTFDSWSTYIPTWYYTFSGSSLTRTSYSTNWSSIRTSKVVTSGKWYWEVEVGNLPTIPIQGAGVMVIGMGASNAELNLQFAGKPNGWGMAAYGSKVNNDVVVAFGQKVWVKGDTIGVALDVDTKVLRFYVNGAPANGTDGIAYTGFSSTTGFAPMIGMKGATASAIPNFGNRPFKYTPPSGFLAYDTTAANFLSEPLKSGTYNYDPGVNYTLSGTTATKRVTQTTSSSVRINKPITSGKWYWEATYTPAAATTDLNRVLVGVAEAKANLSTSFFAGPWGYGYHLAGMIYYNNSAQTGWPVYSAASGDVISVLFDADNGKIYFYRNGIPMPKISPDGLAYSNIPKGTYYPAAVVKYVGDSVKLNLGQFPFRYAPRDASFKPLDPGGDGVRPLSNQLMAATYNANGNPTLYAGKTLTYNDFDRVSRVSTGANTLAQYWYNSNGQRVAKRVGNAVTGYVYDLTGNMISEIDGKGRTLKEYAYLGSERLAMIVPSASTNLINNASMPLPDATRAAGLSSLLTSASYMEAVAQYMSAVAQTQETEGVYFYHNDYLGAPKTLTNMAGALVWKALRDPFGNTTVSTQVVKNNHRLPGQYFDAETGWHQNWMRDYDPATGRYLQADPIGIAGGLNLYAYAVGNPVALLDFTGAVPLSKIFMKELRNGDIVPNMTLYDDIGQGFDIASKVSPDSIVSGESISVVLDIYGDFTATRGDRRMVHATLAALGGGDDGPWWGGAISFSKRRGKWYASVSGYHQLNPSQESADKIANALRKMGIRVEHVFADRFPASFRRPYGKLRQGGFIDPSVFLEPFRNLKMSSLVRGLAYDTIAGILAGVAWELGYAAGTEIYNACATDIATAVDTIVNLGDQDEP